MVIIKCARCRRKIFKYEKIGKGEQKLDVPVEI